MAYIHAGDNAREFSNGNINLRLPAEYIEDIKSGKISDIEAISWVLDGIDSYFIGEEYCLSNFDMGATIYNCYSDLCYVLNFRDIEDVLMKGKTLKLYARKPDEADREILEGEGYGGD